MSSQVSTISLDQTLVAAGLNSENQPFLLYDMAGGYNKLYYMISSMNPNGSTPYNTPVTGYQKTFLDKGDVITQVQNVVLNSPTSLTINFTDPNYNAFLVSDVVQAGNDMGIQGRVTAASAGTITIEPGGGTIATFNPATQFLPGQYIRQISNANYTMRSGARDSRFYTPSLDYNYTQVFRASIDWTRRENIRTKFEPENGFLRFTKDTLLVRNFLRDMELAYLYGNRNRTTSSGRQIDYNGGIDWSIKNRGGEFLPLTSQMTQGQWENFIGNVWDKRTNRTAPLLVMCARPMQALISSFYNNQLQQTGIWNTFGGSEVKGLNLRKFTLGGGLEFMFMDLNFLNDGELFPDQSPIPGMPGRTRQYDVFVVDVDDIPDPVSGKMNPSIEQFHFGDSRFYFGYVPGIEAAGVSDAEIKSMPLNNPRVISTAVDEGSWHLMSDSGIDMVGKFSGKIEIAI